MFGPNWPSSFRPEDFSLFFPIGSYVKTMSADDSHLGWTLGRTITILKGDRPRTIPSTFGHNWPSSFRQEDFSLFFSLGSYVKTMFADGSHLGWPSGPMDTILKGTIQGRFHQSLVPIGQVVEDKKIFHCLC